MPRIARVVAVGLPHHVTQRGNYKQVVFRDNNDWKRYLSWIQEYGSKYDLPILAYCLMPNHVHFIAIPGKEDSLAKTFNTAHMCYSQYLNRKMNATGHLWQGRFYSCVLDESHLLTAAKYVERNPVRAGLVSKPWEWTWSSALVHTDGTVQSSIRLADLLEIVDMSHTAWQQYLDSEDNKDAVNNIRKSTISGRPFGSASFIQQLERQFGRKLFALPKGRPFKKQE